MQSPSFLPFGARPAAAAAAGRSVGASGGSLVKANLVLIQSIWRRGRNNLNGAAHSVAPSPPPRPDTTRRQQGVKKEYILLYELSEYGHDYSFFADDLPPLEKSGRESAGGHPAHLLPHHHHAGGHSHHGGAGGGGLFPDHSAAAAAAAAGLASSHHHMTHVTGIPQGKSNIHSIYVLSSNPL